MNPKKPDGMKRNKILYLNLPQPIRLPLVLVFYTPNSGKKMNS